MTVSDTLYVAIVNYLNNNPSAFPESAIMFKFKINDIDAREALNRILLDENIYG